MERGNYQRGGDDYTGRGEHQIGGGRGGPTWSQPPQQGCGVPSTAWVQPPPQQPHQQGSGGGVSPAWARSPPQKSQEHGGGIQQVVDGPPQSSDPRSLKITEESSFSLPGSCKEQRVPVARPDSGKIDVESITLLANHFPIRFNPKTIIMNYDVDIQQQAPVEKLTNQSNPAELPIDKTDKKNIFSDVQLPTGCFTVNWSDGDDAMGRSYDVIINLVAELQLSKLSDYLSGNLSHIPRDVQGMALCLDYSVVALPEPIPVLKYLSKYLQEPNQATFKNNHQAAQVGLKGLKVQVIHRRTKQKFVIKELTDLETHKLTFPLKDPQGKHSTTEVFLVDYFRDKYQREIQFRDFPSLDIGKGNKKIYVPMEFCVLVEGRRYPKEDLHKDTSLILKNISLVQPQQRREAICEMVQAKDGSCGAITPKFDIGVDRNTTCVVGRILPPPDLKLGSQSRHHMNDKCRSNLVGKSVVEGKEIQRWALIDFSSKNNRDLKGQVDVFVDKLKDWYLRLGINMEEPAVKYFTHMNELSAVDKVEKLLNDVVNEAGQCKLQMIVCVIESKDNGYKYLKWVSETKIGVVTQCCLSTNAYNNAKDQFFANLCLKINAKLGGSNMELMERLPNFGSEDNVMFIGAHVNHPTGEDSEKFPSIAAAVATVNWPAANRYAARVCPQEHRTEKILEFGKMCKDLVDTYARLNSVKPNKIVVFRDGVSESQFDMILKEELKDLVEAIYESDKYRPAITLVVAQKRHHTRLFPKEGNVPPGTVVDTQIVHPSHIDFYLCSHFGQLGTSKATHYHVLSDENGFSSDSLQKLIYNMCFTFARCTKPVSLVTPIYYADLVAYRGRMFQEVLMEMKAPSSTTSPASFEQHFYNLHTDLQNIMFFI